MSKDDDYRLPRGTQVYDAYNGMRIGALVGALLGAILTAVTVPWMAWSILIGAVVCAFLGHGWERRRIARALEASDEG